MRLAFIVLAVVIGAPGLLAALHIGMLAVAGLFYRTTPLGKPHGNRFIVVIPAHEEERAIGATLVSLGEARRDGDQVLVVADRCTDATASIAREHGAEVLERGEHEPAGRAHAREAGLERALAVEGWDALVTLDADCAVPPDFLDVLDRRLPDDVAALQARLAGDGAAGLLGHATEVAFALQGLTLQRGREHLGLAVRMRGPGMVVRREALAGHRYRSRGGSEDLWLCFDLLLDGVTARYVEDAVVRTGGPSDIRAATRQRVRWESGRLIQIREFLGPMLRRRTPATLEVAANLASPPLAIAVLLLVLAAALGALASAALVIAVFGAALVVLAAAVVVTLVSMRAGWRTWTALLLAPAYVGWKAAIQVISLVGIRRRDRWDTPTARG